MVVVVVIIMMLVAMGRSSCLLVLHRDHGDHGFVGSGDGRHRQGDCDAEGWDASPPALRVQCLAEGGGTRPTCSCVRDRYRTAEITCSVTRCFFGGVEPDRRNAEACR